MIPAGAASTLKLADSPRANKVVACGANQKWLYPLRVRASIGDFLFESTEGRDCLFFEDAEDTTFGYRDALGFGQEGQISLEAHRAPRRFPALPLL
jgi:hypothetical protein